MTHLFSDIDDLAEVVKAVEPLAADWQSLATKLHLGHADLKVVKKDCPGDSRACLNQAMAKWLNLSYNTARFGVPSWRMLVTAVMDMNKALACEIAKGH